MNYKTEHNQFTVSLKPENGKDLIFSGESNFIYDKDGKVIDSESRY